MWTRLRSPPESRPDLLLLIAALEVEGGAIGAAVHLRVAQLDDLAAVADFFPDGLVGTRARRGTGRHRPDRRCRHS